MSSMSDYDAFIDTDEAISPEREAIQKQMKLLAKQFKEQTLNEERARKDILMNKPFSSVNRTEVEARMREFAIMDEKQRIIDAKKKQFENFPFVFKGEPGVTGIMNKIYQLILRLLCTMGNFASFVDMVTVPASFPWTTRPASGKDMIYNYDQCEELYLKSYKDLAELYELFATMSSIIDDIGNPIPGIIIQPLQHMVDSFNNNLQHYQAKRKRTEDRGCECESGDCNSAARNGQICSCKRAGLPCTYKCKKCPGRCKNDYNHQKVNTQPIPNPIHIDSDSEEEELIQHYTAVAISQPDIPFAPPIIPPVAPVAELVSKVVKICECPPNGVECCKDGTCPCLLSDIGCNPLCICYGLKKNRKPICRNVFNRADNLDISTSVNNKSAYTPLYFTEDESVNLLNAIDNEVIYIPREDLPFKIFNKVNLLRRDKAFYSDFDDYGTHYLYRYTGYDPNVVPIKPFTPTLAFIRDRIFATTGQYCTHLVVNQYQDHTDYIGPHMDKVKDFVDNSSVYTVSFGCTRTIKLSQTENKYIHYSIQLENGSLFELDWDTNASHKHEILTERAECGRRVSLTYRAIKTKYNPLTKQLLTN